MSDEDDACRCASCTTTYSKQTNPMERSMTTMNNYKSFAEAVEEERKRLADEMARIADELDRLGKLAALLKPSAVATVPPEPGRAPMAPRRHPTTMRDWIARIATQQGTVTRDAVIEAAAKRGRRYSQSSVACELSQMKREGLLRKVPKGYQAASA